MPESPSQSVSAPIPAWRTRLVRADTRAGWDASSWTSGILSPGFAADQAVASWNLDAGVRAEVEICARTVDGAWHPWLPLASWGAAGERTSPAPAAAPGADAAPSVDTDVLGAAPGTGFDAVRLRITVADAADALRLAAVSFSAPAESEEPAEPSPRPAHEPEGAAAAVRPLSQRAYPARTDLGGGGPAWCSPTSLTMVLDAWGATVPEASAPDVPAGADARVPWVARAVFDSAYDGTGNWSFNAALAGSLGFDGVVTRLSTLDQAQVLTDAGIPLIASISFAPGELPGADYATLGHLVVVRGFNAAGDVLTADPANPGGDAGLRTYPRAAFDRAWTHSRRTVYLVTPRGHALPAASGDAAW